jgi:hypothetical protein
MLNKTTILQRVVIPVIADQFMVRSRTTAIRGLPSIRGIEINLRLHPIQPGQTPTFAIIPSTAAGCDIQANKSKDSDLIGDSLPKPATKPSSSQNCTHPKQANPPLNRTYHSDLRPLPHAR